MITTAGTAAFFNTGLYSFIPTTWAANIPANAVGGIKSPREAINDIADPVIIWFCDKNMMMYIYLALVLYVLIMVVLNLLEEKDLMKQVNAALVIIPLLLRILMIK